MKTIFFLAALIIVFLLRLFFFYAFPLPLHHGQRVSFTTTLYQDPKVFGNRQEFFVRIGDFWHSSTILITAPLDTPISFGQEVTITGTVEERLLKNTNPILTIQNPQIEAKNSGFLPFFTAIRQKIVNFCENNFSQPYSSLLVSIIFGMKQSVPNQETASFRITGLSHLLVVDGLKITLVAGFLFDFFARFFRRRVALVLSIGSIAGYVALSGFEISAVRAGIMISVAYSSQLVGRQYTGLYSLLLVGIAFLLWDPLLITQVAFQLSFLATAGIIVLTPPMARLKEIMPDTGILLDDLGITLAAQLATLPILISTFGEISIISIPAHLLVMWAIPLVMVLGSVGIGIGLGIPILGKGIVLFTIPLLWYLQSVSLFLSSHFSTWQVPGLPLALSIGYYLLLIACILVFKSSHNHL